MTVLYPEATQAKGNTLLAVVPTIADPTQPDLSSEISAVGSLTIPGFLYGESLGADAETNKGTAPVRVLDDSEREVDGRTKFTITDLQYLYDPQGSSSVDANKAKTLLTPGTTVWIVERLGLPGKTSAWTAGQKVNLHQVKLGKQRRTRTGDDEFAEFSITQSVTYVRDPIYDVALVA